MGTFSTKSPQVPPQTVGDCLLNIVGSDELWNIKRNLCQVYTFRIVFGVLFILSFILSSTEIIKFTRKAKARGLNGLVSIMIIEDC